MPYVAWAWAQSMHVVHAKLTSAAWAFSRRRWDWAFVENGPASLGWRGRFRGRGRCNRHRRGRVGAGDGPEDFLHDGPQLDGRGYCRARCLNRSLKKSPKTIHPTTRLRHAAYDRCSRLGTVSAECPQ